MLLPKKIMLLPTLIHVVVVVYGSNNLSRNTKLPINGMGVIHPERQRHAPERLARFTFRASHFVL
jgi:hypothetical protein